MHIISDEGRTSVVYRLEDGLVLKLPRESIPASMATEIENAFAVERRLLERLGQHPQIVQYVPISTSRLYYANVAQQLPWMLRDV